MTKLQVLYPYFTSIADETPNHLPEFNEFCERFEVIFHQVTTPEALIKSFHNELSNVSAMFFTDRFNFFGEFKDYIPHLPLSLKMIAYPWVGSDIFHPELLKKRGILLCNVGETCRDDVADVALQLTLNTFRFTSFLESTFQATKDVTKARCMTSTFELDKSGYPTGSTGTVVKGVNIGGKSVESPRGRVAGIVGLGAIGKAISRRLDCIGMKIKYTKRNPLTEEELRSLPLELEYSASVKELIPQVDVLILCVPETPETIDLINSESIKLFKRGARIVNVGRGSAINEDALLEALDNGQIRSFGADVFRNEPKIDERFINRFDVSILPHIGPFTCDNFNQAHAAVLGNITNSLIYDCPTNVVN